MNFDKLGHFLKGNKPPVESIDMKKASHIREKHPKYRNMDVRQLMKDPIWNKTNTNGNLTQIQ